MHIFSHSVLSSGNCKLSAHMNVWISPTVHGHSGCKLRFHAQTLTSAPTVFQRLLENYVELEWGHSYSGDAVTGLV